MRMAYWMTGLSLLACTAAGFAQPAEPPAYLDDRSDASAIVKSFYNAISRREYARAWDYFGDKKPSKDFDTFVKGYENTSLVQIVTGEPSVEGAAGSTFYSLPVALLATDTGDSQQVFAGCYTARLGNPQNQEPPFRGLTIEGAELTLSEQPFEDQLPEKCGDGAAPDRADSVVEKAMEAFTTLHASQCSSALPDRTSGPPEAYSISFRRAGSPDDAPESTARLFRFPCGMGAYNESHVYYLHDEVEGLRELQFATPELDIRYEGDSEDKVESVTIMGYRAEAELLNSFYDEATRAITSSSKWRGLGDASSGGTWLFRDGMFTLVKYEVDASYDEEINPETVLDFDTGP
jgi:hypothetical protein